MPSSESGPSASGLGARVRARFWWLPIGRVPGVTAEVLAQRLAADPPQLLDVRSAREWQQSRIAGSVNVPIDQLSRRLPALALDPHKPVVTICMTAHRSIPAVRLLLAHGFVDVAQLAGGMLAWWRAEMPTIGEKDR